MSKLLEEFKCIAEKFDGEVAYVTMVSLLNEDELWAEFPVATLKKHGIKENRRFKCRVMEVDELTTRMELEAIPDKELTPEREREIQENIERLLGADELPESDY